jgi:hypothetical protein
MDGVLAKILKILMFSNSLACLVIAHLPAPNQIYENISLAPEP